MKVRLIRVGKAGRARRPGSASSRARPLATRPAGIKIVAIEQASQHIRLVLAGHGLQNPAGSIQNRVDPDRSRH
jgi:hypothetical protein